MHLERIYVCTSTHVRTFTRCHFTLTLARSGLTITFACSHLILNPMTDSHPLPNPVTIPHPIPTTVTDSHPTPIPMTDPHLIPNPMTDPYPYDRSSPYT